MDLKLMLWIRNIAKKLCEGSDEVENLVLTLEGDILKAQRLDFSTDIVLSEIYDAVIKENIHPDSIREYIIAKLGKNLCANALESGTSNLADIFKQI